MEYLPSDEVLRGLGDFRNIKDEDIETFLRFKALEFEKRHWCTTYLLVDVEKIILGNLVVAGFFTLSNKVLKIDEKVGRGRKKKFFNGIIREDNCLHVILIGQLAKYLDYNASAETTMEELLDAAFEIIDDVNEKISCRCVLLECQTSLETDSEEEKIKRNKLHQKYMDYGFEPLQKDGNLIQYIMTTF